MKNIIDLIALITNYAYHATIWYAAICIIKDYRRKYPKDKP